MNLLVRIREPWARQFPAVIFSAPRPSASPIIVGRTRGAFGFDARQREAREDQRKIAYFAKNDWAAGSEPAPFFVFSTQHLDLEREDEQTSYSGRS